jgi:hypothetical protein
VPENLNMSSLSYWGDLAAKVDQETSGSWAHQLSRLQRYERYYNGQVFDKRVEDPENDNPPLLYPIGINISKMLCLAMTDAAFGEWKEAVVNFEQARDVQATDDTIETLKLMGHIARASKLNSTLWEVELDRQKFGGGILKVHASDRGPNFVRWIRIPTMEFFPVVDPTNEDRFLSVRLVSEITQEQARLKFGYDGDREKVVVEETWDLKRYRYTVDNKEISAYSGLNPFGVVPFVYIPRFRSSDWYGESLIEDVARAQDELNMRLADLGESINYNTHPTRIGKNLPKRFNAKNFPLGKNTLWDLGRAFAGGPQPEVSLLEAKNPIPSGTFDFITWIYDWSRTSVFAPPIAFGEDDGGGQRSGITLEIRMQPLLKAVRRSRSYMISGLENAMDLTAHILEKRKVTNPEYIRIMREQEIVPNFASVMPRDQAALVDEVVKRMSTVPQTISLESALKLLGSPASEEQAILEQMEAMVEFQRRFSDVGNAPSEDSTID